MSAADIFGWVLIAVLILCFLAAAIGLAATEMGESSRPTPSQFDTHLARDAETYANRRRP